MAARRRRARAGPVVAPGLLLQRLHPRSAGPGGPPPFFANAQVSRRTRRWEARVRRETCAFAGMCPSVRWRFPQSSPPATARGRGDGAKRWLPRIFHPSFHDRPLEEWRNDAIRRTASPPRALKSTQEPPFSAHRRTGGDSRRVEYLGEALSGSTAELVGERVRPGRARGPR